MVKISNVLMKRRHLDQDSHERYYIERYVVKKRYRSDAKGLNKNSNEELIHCLRANRLVHCSCL